MPHTQAKKRGRPAKLHRWIVAFERVVNDGMNSIYYTDDELRQLTNFEVEEKYQITSRTFENWKAGNLQDPLLEQFRILYFRALLAQKNRLFQRLTEDDKWQKWTWIIERKFEDWNLKNKQETTHKIEQPLFPDEISENYGNQ